MRYISTSTITTKKDRRHSGRVTPKCLIKAKREEIINECLDPQPYWNDWQDGRDGGRFANIGDGSKFMPPSAFDDEDLESFKILERNAKNNKLLKRRKLMKEGRKNEH